MIFLLGEGEGVLNICQHLIQDVVIVNHLVVAQGHRRLDFVVMIARSCRDKTASVHVGLAIAWARYQVRCTTANQNARTYL